MTLKIGYARVSTDDQTLDLQIDALTAAGCETIYQEYASGKSATARPELDNCLKALRAGDTLIVWKLDRLARNLHDLIKIVNELETKGIAFESLTEKIETHSPSGKLIFHVFGALGEFERGVIRERTNAGIKAARARGRVGGRPKALTPQDAEMVRSLMADKNNQVKDIAARFGVSRNTLYRTTAR